jgi:hypothetical protein
MAGLREAMITWRADQSDGTGIGGQPFATLSMYGCPLLPAAALIAIEELRKARIKRQHSSHIFVCPRVMTPEWRKHLHKASNVVITVPVGHPVWPKQMIEPILIGFVFPFVRHDPWQI